MNKGSPKLGKANGKKSGPEPENHQSAGTVAGRKRKKKKKGEKEGIRVEVEGKKLTISTLGTHSQGAKGPALVAMVINGADSHSSSLSDSSLRRLEERHSSSSSLENSNPFSKIGRYEYSSSDVMSIGHTSSSAAMEVSSASQSIHGSPFQSKTQVQPSLHSSMPPIPPDSSNITVCSVMSNTFSTSTSTSQSSHETEREMVNADVSVPSMLESLRWDQEYSDEERERERIEVYKSNRRKRYEKALEERRTQVMKKNPYYTPSESVS